MIRKICVVTGTRAEYGLLRWVMEGIRTSSTAELQLLVTGSHLSPEFGLTYRQIEADGFRIDGRVEMLVSSDTPVGISKSIGLGVIGFATELDRLRPDLMVVLGDRFEILAAVTAALVARIPVAHLHGGETTEGAIDEAIRHSITKMSQLHFVAAEEYRARVIQLGEQPDRVFLVGGLGVDAIRRLPLLERPALEESLGFTLGDRNLLVTFHPVTLEADSASAQLEELFAALDRFPDVHLIFTMPNADTDGRALIAMIERYVAGRANARAFTSLGQSRYLSTLRLVDAVVGNSSSGLTEAPTLHTPTVDIGDRQRGRAAAASVVHCEPSREAIAAAIDRVYDARFRATLSTVRSPYGDGGASARIVDVITRTPLDGVLKKVFNTQPVKQT